MERLLSAGRTLFSRRHWPLAGVIVAVALGAVLRLVWVRDMEWKGDESWTDEQTQKVHSWSDLPWTGMPASVGIPNPALSLWVFVGLSKLFAVADPTGLARAVQICNIAALVLLVWFAYRFVPEREREPWLWAAALVAVNPMAVLLQRKIWPPSVLPLLTMVMLCAWHRRESRAGAFRWGLVAVCSGQIHMGGFFFAAGFALWALLFDRRRVAWGAWLCGSCLGALPMLPWLWAGDGPSPQLHRPQQLAVCSGMQVLDALGSGVVRLGHRLHAGRPVPRFPILSTRLRPPHLPRRRSSRCAGSSGLRIAYPSRLVVVGASGKHVAAVRG